MGFNGSHPVASVAARSCRTEHGHVPSWGDVACVGCWDAALVADRELAAEAGLPVVCPADPFLVDEVAVARAAAGEPVELTVAEWKAAKRAIAERRGVTVRNAAELLSGHVTVVDALGGPLEGHALIAALHRRPRRRLARSRWAVDKRRSSLPLFQLPAGIEAA